MENRAIGLAEWVNKYGRIVAYTSGVVVLTVFFIRFDSKFNEGNRQLSNLNDKVQALQTQVSSLQDLVRDREKYDRWRRQINVRTKRLYNENGWIYEDIE